MTDPVTLKKALERFDNPDSLEDWAVNRSMDLAHGILAAAAREYLAFLEGPTDEDVEAAALALSDVLLIPDPLDPEHQIIVDAVRAALEAVAEARRQR